MEVLKTRSSSKEARDPDTALSMLTAIRDVKLPPGRSASQPEHASELKAETIHTLLKDLLENKSPRLTEISRDLLLHLVCIEEVSASDKIQWEKEVHAAKERKSRNYPRLTRDRGELKDDIEKLEKGLKSRLHRWTSWKSTLEKERDSLAEKRDELAGVNGEIKELDIAISDTEKVRSKLEALVAYKGQSFQKTDRAKPLCELFDALGSELSSVNLTEVLSRFKKSTEALIGCFERLNETYEYLVNEAGFDEDLKVAELALTLSFLKGEPKETAERARVINDYLSNQGWTTYDRLRVVTSAAALPGSIEEIKKEISEIYELLLEDGHDSSCGTLGNAVLCIKIPGSDPEEKFDRMTKLATLLCSIGWDEEAESTYTVAAALACIPGKPRKIVKDFDALEDALLEFGFPEEDVETGFAAALMLQAEGTSKEKANLLDHTARTLFKYDWGKYTELIPIAALTSLMPDSMEENVFYLNQAWNLIDESSLKKLIEQHRSEIGESSSEDYTEDPDEDGEEMSYDEDVWTESSRTDRTNLLALGLLVQMTAKLIAQSESGPGESPVVKALNEKLPGALSSVLANGAFDHCYCFFGGLNDVINSSQ